MNTFKQSLDAVSKKLTFAVQEIILDFTEQIAHQMRKLGINKIELSDRLKTSPAYVTKLLKGEYNFTLETMVKLSRALDSKIEVRLCPRNSGSEWFQSDSESVVVVGEKEAKQAFRPCASKDQWRKSTNPARFRPIPNENVTT